MEDNNAKNPLPSILIPNIHCIIIYMWPFSTIKGMDPLISKRIIVRGCEVMISMGAAEAVTHLQRENARLISTRSILTFSVFLQMSHMTAIISSLLESLLMEGWINSLDLQFCITYWSTQNSVVNSPGCSPTPFSYFETKSFPSTVNTESVDALSTWVS